MCRKETFLVPKLACCDSDAYVLFSWLKKKGGEKRRKKSKENPKTT